MFAKRIGTLFTAAVAVLLLSLVSLAILPTDISYASYPPTNGKCNDGNAPKETDSQGTKVCADDQKAPVAGQGQQDIQGGQESPDEVTCAIEKIGWILCPVLETASKASDKLFHFLSSNLLEIEPELFNINNGGGGTSTTNGVTTQKTSQNGTYEAWKLAKDLANVMFIIAFVVIIISQVTSYGISNYGIKRMLPRLIVAAIAVNVSYFICQAIVDISNILGYNLHQALVDIAKNVGPAPFAGGDGSGGEFESSDGFLSLIAKGILLTAGAVWLFMAPLGAVLMFVIITVVTITLILLLRKAFIVLLVVASPIAFVMYLLPNTEQYFQKWLSMFWKLLLVFPIVALLMGGGQLASAIILSAGAEKTTTTTIDPKNACKSGEGGTGKSLDSGNDCEGTVVVKSTTKGDKNVSWSLGLIATGVAVAPLLAVWSVLQGAISAAGAIGGKMAAAVSKAQDRQKGKLSDARKNTPFARARMARQAGAQERKFQKFNTRMRGKSKNPANLATQIAARGIGGNIGAVAGKLGEKIDNPKLQKALSYTTGGFQAQNDALMRGVNSQAREAEEKQKKEAALGIQTMLSADAEAEGNKLVASGSFDSPKLAALLEHLAKIDQQAFMRLSSQLGGHGETMATRTAAGAMTGMSGFYGGSDMAAMQRGQAGDMVLRAQGNIANGSMSSNVVAGLSGDGINTLKALAPVGSAGHAEVVKAINNLSADQRGNLAQGKKNDLNSHFGTSIL